MVPFPPCVAHPDGSIRQTNKSQIHHYLKGQIKSNPPISVDNVIVDGMFIIQSIARQSFLTYAALARTILIKVMKLAKKRVDLCFDVYECPSIKDAKRMDRGDDLTTEEVFCFGPRQKPPKDMKVLMKLSNYKKELLRFLAQEFLDQANAGIIGNKVLYCAIDNECQKYFQFEGQLVSESVPDLYGSHLEADTRIMLHVKHIDENNPGNIVVRGNDTDITVILLSNSHVLSNHSKLWYDSGLDSNNSGHYIDISKLAETFPFVKALPGIYSFTGNDYIPCFYRKSKVRAIDIFSKNDSFKTAFESLGEKPLDDVTLSVIEKFVCYLYGYVKEDKIQNALKQHFEDKCKVKPNRQPLDNIKLIDFTSFPPCRKVILQQIKRSWFISKLYKSSYKQYPLEDLSPLDYGWQLSDCRNFLDINWLEGEQVPSEIEDINVDEDVDDESDNELHDEEDSSDFDSDSD